MPTASPAACWWASILNLCGCGSQSSCRFCGAAFRDERIEPEEMPGGLALLRLMATNYRHPAIHWQRHRAAQLLQAAHRRSLGFLGWSLTASVLAPLNCVGARLLTFGFLIAF